MARQHFDEENADFIAHVSFCDGAHRSDAVVHKNAGADNSAAS